MNNKRKMKKKNKQTKRKRNWEDQSSREAWEKS
jgi:hypothetical protein